MKAGLQAGDVIVAYNGHAIAKVGDLPRLVASAPIGQQATVQVLREGKPLTLTTQVTEMPGPQQMAETAHPARERLGLSVQPLSPALSKQLGVPEKNGLVVTGVKDGSPAAEAGIQPGDVIVEVNRRPVKTVADLRQAIAGQKPGEPTLFRIHRKDASLFVAVTANG